MRHILVALTLGLAACSHRAAPPPVTTVGILAFNDLHGHLEPPRRTVEVPGPGGTRVPAGGMAYLAGALTSLRARHPNHMTVAAGDLVGASPLASALFLDEPTILALNAMRLDYAAAGNHEFDRGAAELGRLARGGCARHAAFDPCAVDPAFPGSRFQWLTANTFTASGGTLFAPYAIRRFGRGRAAVRVAVVGLTLEGTPSVVTPAGVAGLRFGDEADTVNALVPKLKAEGADAIVVVVHEGARTTDGANGCAGLSGDLPGVLDRLDPAVDVVVSGHTHRAYVCDYPRPGRTPLLLTSAGQFGTLVTDIELRFEGRRLAARRATNVVVQGEAFDGAPQVAEVARFAADPAVQRIVDRYVAAAAPRAARPAGRLSGPAPRGVPGAFESVAGNLVADAQLSATRGQGAQVALMNPGGLRADLVPAADGTVSYGQLFAVQPLGNGLVTKTLTGAQLRAVLEQQFDRASPTVLSASAGLVYGFDLTRPAGQRVIDARLDGQPLDDAARYRVTMNSFLASGGDGFTVFADGTDAVGGAQDLDALEAWLQGGQAPPRLGRVTSLAATR